MTISENCFHSFLSLIPLRDPVISRHSNSYLLPFENLLFSEIFHKSTLKAFFEKFCYGKRDILMIFQLTFRFNNCGRYGHNRLRSGPKGDPPFRWHILVFHVIYFTYLFYIISSNFIRRNFI